MPLSTRTARVGRRRAAPHRLRSARAMPGALRPHAFVELHIEQGPILDEEKTTIGVVDRRAGHLVDRVHGDRRPNHAGTTPMRLRRDAGYLAASVNVFVRKLAWEMGGHQVATVGALSLQAQPRQRRAQPGDLHRRPAQHRRGEAEGRRGARRRSHRRRRAAGAGRRRGQRAGPLRAGDLRCRPGRSRGASRQGAVASARGACRRAPATTRR